MQLRWEPSRKKSGPVRLTGKLKSKSPVQSFIGYSTQNNYSLSGIPMGINQYSRFSARFTHHGLPDGAEIPHDLCGHVKGAFTADALHML